MNVSVYPLQNTNRKVAEHIFGDNLGRLEIFDLRDNNLGFIGNFHTRVDGNLSFIPISIVGMTPFEIYLRAGQNYKGQYEMLIPFKDELIELAASCLRDSPINVVK